MARDYLDLVGTIEGYYPRAIGGNARDEPLRLQLVTYANNAMKEIERMRRWTLSYGTSSITTAQGTATYPIPAGILTITNLYYLTTTGSPVRLDDYSAMQLRDTYGEGSLPPQGAPRGFAILGTNIQLFPVPDNAGPTAGNYQLVVEGYQALQQIVETTGTLVAPTATLTVPSTPYLAQKGIPTSGTTGLSVRAAGYPQSAVVTDNWITNWSAFPLSTTVTMTTAAQSNVTNTQTFFNSVNWLIVDYPKVMEFAMMREVAAYLKSDIDYKMWEARYQHELDLMAEFHFDRLTTLEQFAVSTLGQRQNELRRLDYPLIYEVRGGIVGL
jgi:hypothetical protein